MRYVVLTSALWLKQFALKRLLTGWSAILFISFLWMSVIVIYGYLFRLSEATACLFDHAAEHGGCNNPDASQWSLDSGASYFDKTNDYYLSNSLWVMFITCVLPFLSQLLRTRGARVPAPHRSAGMCIIAWPAYIMALAGTRVGSVGACADALAVVRLRSTTVGYGDSYATTHLGRMVSVFTALAGILLVSVLTASLGSIVGSNPELAASLLAACFVVVLCAHACAEHTLSCDLGHARSQCSPRRSTRRCAQWRASSARWPPLTQTHSLVCAVPCPTCADSALARRRGPGRGEGASLESDRWLYPRSVSVVADASALNRPSAQDESEVLTGHCPATSSFASSVSGSLHLVCEEFAVTRHVRCFRGCASTSKPSWTASAKPKSCPTW